MPPRTESIIRQHRVVALFSILICPVSPPNSQRVPYEASLRASLRRATTSAIRWCRGRNVIRVRAHSWAVGELMLGWLWVSLFQGSRNRMGLSHHADVHPPDNDYPTEIEVAIRALLAHSVEAGAVALEPSPIRPEPSPVVRVSRLRRLRASSSAITSAVGTARAG